MKRFACLLAHLWTLPLIGSGCGFEPEAEVRMPTQPPSLAILSPKEDKTYFVGLEPITAAVEASDPLGRVEVEIFLEERSLGVLGSAPYEFPLALDKVLVDDSLERRLTLRVEARGPSGRSASQSRSFQVTRRVLWTRPMKGPLLGSPAPMGEQVLVTTADGKVVSFRSTGEEDFRFQADNAVVAPASVLTGGAGVLNFVIGDIQGVVYQIGPKGKLVTSKVLGAKPGAISAPITGDGSNSTQGQLHAPMLDGRVNSFTLANPTPSTLACIRDQKLRLPILESLAVYEDGVVASCAVAQPTTAFYDPGEKSFWTPPARRLSATGGAAVLLGGRDGKLYEFTPAAVTKPQIIASLTHGAILTRPFVAEDKTLFVATEQGMLYRLSEIGDILWKISDPGATWLEPTATDSMVYTATAGGVVRAYPLHDRSTPRPVWQLALGKPLQDRPVILHGILYVSSAEDKGTLFALDAR